MLKPSQSVKIGKQGGNCSPLTCLLLVALFCGTLAEKANAQTYDAYRYGGLELRVLRAGQEQKANVTGFGECTGTTVAINLSQTPQQFASGNVHWSVYSISW